MSAIGDVHAIDDALTASLGAAIVTASLECLLLLDGDLKVIAASNAFCRSFDLDTQGVVGQAFFTLGGGAWDVPELWRLLQAAVRDAGPAMAVAITLRHPGRKPSRLVAHAVQLVYAARSSPRLLLALTDPIDEPTLGMQIEALRQTDALLLKEGRHRISNGLQIIAGVLLRNTRLTDAEEMRSHLRAAYASVMAIAALERQLSSTSDDKVELQAYLGELCRHLSDSAIEDPSRVSLRLFVGAGQVEASAAANIGMIVAELVTNALKHAFPGKRQGYITISYDATGDAWRLTVADNGVGMPANPGERGLGTKIVSALAKQLGASVEISDGAPGKVTLIRRLTAKAGRDGAAYGDNPE